MAKRPDDQDRPKKPDTEHVFDFQDFEILDEPAEAKQPEGFPFADDPAGPAGHMPNLSLDDPTPTPTPRTLDDMNLDEDVEFTADGVSPGGDPASQVFAAEILEEGLSTQPTSDLFAPEFLGDEGKTETPSGAKKKPGMTGRNFHVDDTPTPLQSPAPPTIPMSKLRELLNEEPRTGFGSEQIPDEIPEEIHAIEEVAEEIHEIPEIEALQAEPAVEEDVFAVETMHAVPPGLPTQPPSDLFATQYLEEALEPEPVEAEAEPDELLDAAFKMGAIPPSSPPISEPAIEAADFGAEEDVFLAEPNSFGPVSRHDDPLPLEIGAPPESGVFEAEEVAEVEEIAEALPSSDVFMAEFLEEATTAAPAATNAPGSDVFVAEFLEEAVEAAPVEANPASDVFMADFLEEAVESPQPAPLSEVKIADEPIEVVEEPQAIEVVEPGSGVFEAEFIAEAEEPAEHFSDVVAAEIHDRGRSHHDFDPDSEVFASDVVEAEPASVDASAAPAAPISDIFAGDDIFATETLRPVQPVEAAPISDAIAADDAIFAESPSAVEAVDAVEAAPASEAFTAEDVFASESIAADKGPDAAPESDLFAADFLNMKSPPTPEPVAEAPAPPAVPAAPVAAPVAAAVAGTVAGAAILATTVGNLGNRGKPVLAKPVIPATTEPPASASDSEINLGSNPLDVRSTPAEVAGESSIFSALRHGRFDEDDDESQFSVEEPSPLEETMMGERQLKDVWEDAPEVIEEVAEAVEEDALQTVPPGTPFNMDDVVAAEVDESVAFEAEEAEPTSDVFEADFLEAEPISGTSRKSEVVIDMGDSDVVAAEVRDVVETDTGKNVGKLAKALSDEDLDIAPIEEAMPESDVFAQDEGLKPTHASESEIFLAGVPEADEPVEVVEAESKVELAQDLEADSAARKKMIEDVPVEDMDIFQAEMQEAVEADSGVEIEEAVEEVVDDEPIGFADDKKKKVRGSELTEADHPVLEWEDFPGGVDYDKDAEVLEAADETVAFEAEEVEEVDFDAVEAAEDASAVDLGKRLPIKDGASASGIDPLAEALESGVNLDRDSSRGKKKSTFQAEELDIDDLLAGQADEVDEVAEVEEAEEDMTGTIRPGKSGKPAPKLAAFGDEDIDIDALTQDEDEITAADDIDEVVEEALADDEQPAAEIDEEVTEVAEDDPWGEEGRDSAMKKRASRNVESYDDIGEEEAVADLDEEAEEPLARPSAVATRPAPKPKYGRRWFGGVILGTLLIGAGAAGVWYTKPDLIQNLVKESPAFVPEPKGKFLTPTEEARLEFGKGNFQGALDKLANVGKSPENLYASAEARWQQYVVEQGKANQPLDKKNFAVEKAILELEEAKADPAFGAQAQALQKQIQQVLDQQELSKQVVVLQERDKAAMELRDILVNNKLADPKIDVKDLGPVVDQLVKSKSDTDKKVDDMVQSLVKSKVLDDKADATPEKINAALKDFVDSKSQIEVVNKVLEKAEIKEAGDKGVAMLVSAWKDLEMKVAEINKVLAGAEVKDDGIKGVRELVQSKTQIDDDRKALEKTIQMAVDELVKADVLPKEADPRKAIMEGLKEIRSRAESPLVSPLTQLMNGLGTIGNGAAQYLEKGLDNTALAAELNFYRVREPLIASPAQKLDSYVMFFQDRAKKGDAETAQALKEVNWLLSKEAKSPADVQGKALYVSGLILRNQDKVAEAKEALSQAVDAGQKSPGPWVKQAQLSLRELTEPAVYYLPKIEKFQNDGNSKAALSELNNALKVAPDDGQLLAQRGLIVLEMARSQGRVQEELANVRQDAEKASEDPKAAAGAAYVLGQVEEEAGNFDKAEQLYRQATKLHQGDPEVGSRYFIALARLLQRDRGAAVPKIEQPKIDEKKELQKDVRNLAPAGKFSFLTTVTHALVRAQVPGAIEDDDPVAQARLQESIEIARKLMLSDNPKIRGQGHLLLGQAFSKQGKRADGLREYMRGMEMLYPGVETRNLAKLLDEHPAFQLAETQRTNPYLAEQFYGQGLHLFFAREYAEAEQQFKQAVAYFDQDARYHYYLGLAQLSQPGRLKRDAANFSFERAARLEAAGKPNSGEVNASLMRVQGETRQILNTFRQRTLTFTN